MSIEETGAKLTEKVVVLSPLTTEVEEQLGGIRVVKAFGNENIASNKVDQAIDNIYEKSLDYLDLRTRFVPIFELIPMIITLFVLVLGGFLSVNDYITLGDFIAFNQYVFLLMWPLRITAWFLSEIPASVSAANRILELLNEKPAIVNNENVEKGSEILAAELASNISRYDFAIQIAKLASYQKRFHNDFNYPIISTPKIITTGQGGMIVTNNKNLYEKCMELKDFGRKIGAKKKMTPMNVPIRATNQTAGFATR